MNTQRHPLTPTTEVDFWKDVYVKSIDQSSQETIHRGGTSSLYRFFNRNLAQYGRTMYSLGLSISLDSNEQYQRDRGHVFRDRHRDDFETYLRSIFAQVHMTEISGAVLFAMFDKDNQCEGVITVDVIFSASSKMSVFGSVFSSEKAHAIRHHCRSIEYRAMSINTWHVDDKKLEVETHNVPETKRRAPRDVQYPFLKGGIEMVIESILDKRAPSYYFFGAPGSGKTTLAREIGWRWSLDRKYGDVYFIDDAHVLEHRAIVPALRQLRDAFIIVDDCDKFLSKRTEGNSQMSALLGTLDGVVPTTNTVVFCSNLTDLKKVDEAVFRSGRNGRTFMFDALTLAQARAVREDLGLPGIEKFPERTEKLPLAEIVNYEDYLEKYKIDPLGFIG